MCPAPALRPIHAAIPEKAQRPSLGARAEMYRQHCPQSEAAAIRGARASNLTNKRQAKLGRALQDRLLQPLTPKNNAAITNGHFRS